MALTSSLEHLVQIPAGDIPGIRLVDTDLKLAAELLFHEMVEFVASDKHIHAVRPIVLNFDRAALTLLNFLPLFVGKSGSHVRRLYH